MYTNSDFLQKWHPDKHPEDQRDTATEKFKEISGAYQVLSNQEKRDYYDRTGRVADSEDDMHEADAFMDDLMRQFYTGPADDFDDFDQFVTFLEGGNDQ